MTEWQAWIAANETRGSDNSGHSPRRHPSPPPRPPPDSTPPFFKRTLSPPSRANLQRAEPSNIWHGLHSLRREQTWCNTASNGSAGTADYDPRDRFSQNTGAGATGQRKRGPGVGGGGVWFVWISVRFEELGVGWGSGERQMDSEHGREGGQMASEHGGRG